MRLLCLQLPCSPCSFAAIRCKLRTSHAALRHGPRSELRTQRLNRLIVTYVLDEGAWHGDSVHIEVAHVPRVYIPAAMQPGTRRSRDAIGVLAPIVFLPLQRLNNVLQPMSARE